MPTLGNALDFAKYEGRNLRAHVLGAAPSSPVTGQIFFNSSDNTLYWWDGSVWQPAKASAGGSNPVGPASGDLSGTYPSPQIATGVIVDADVNASAAIAEAKLSLASDAVAATPSRRSLGAGATQAMPGNRTLDAITAPAAALNLNSQRITGLADPTTATDGANKQYVDTTAQGLDAKHSVRAASTANLTLSGTQTVDTIALIANDRVLVKDQTTTSANGIYLVQAGAWVRTTDADTWTELISAHVWVESGSQQDTGWVCTVDQGGTLGTTGVTWTQFSGAGQINAGAGLTKTGSTLDVVGVANRVTVAADSVDIAANYAGQNTITTVGTVTTGVWNGTAVPVANGGTGQTTAKTARETGLSAPGYYSSATHGAGTTITIAAATHGLRASRGLIVQAQDEATGAVELPDMVVAANGDVTVTYGTSVTANSKRVTVIG